MNNLNYPASCEFETSEKQVEQKIYIRNGVCLKAVICTVVIHEDRV